MITISHNNDRGVASIVALFMVTLLLILGLMALSASDSEVSIAGNTLQEMRAFYAAEAGLERAASELQREYEETGLPPINMPAGSDSINSALLAYRVVDAGPAEQRVLTQGTLAGLHALVKSFDVSATALSVTDNARIRLHQSFETALVPIFQFAVFYDKDLEIAPGPEMTLIGRVHSNSDLWVQANASLHMDSYVTAAGDLLHGRKGPGGIGSGDVLIKDASGSYVSLTAGNPEDTDGNGWLDHRDDGWYNESINRWDGRMQDGAHGQAELNLPLTTAGDNPHAIIEPADGGNSDSYENLATLKVIDGRAYEQVGGVWSDVTADMTSRGIITYSGDQFYDQREGHWVDALEFDVGRMYSEGYAPSNGVVYFSDEITSSGEWPAVRIRNAERLGGPLTIASENPVYTLGDFNSDNKQPAALMADAITFLSSNWDDNQSTDNKSVRGATETTVNASYLTGNIETTDSDYNGGFENLPRFLEVWSGVPFNWTGSAINLWNAVQANGTWSGAYYSPPIRNWKYDTDLDDPYSLPPETPMIRIFQRTGWRQEDVGYSEAAAELGIGG